MKTTPALQAMPGFQGDQYDIHLLILKMPIRNTNHVTETLYRRAADILNVDEKLLHSSKNAEEMQVGFC